MRRYTDMPVGFTVPVNAELVADILLMRDLYWHVPRGRSWCVAAQREEIISLLTDYEIDSAICEKVACEIAEEGQLHELSDALVDAVIDGYEYAACSGIVQELGNIENPRSANEYHCRAHALLEQGEQAAALAAYDRAVEESPACVTYLESRAQMLESLGRFHDAEADWLAAYTAAAVEADVLGQFNALAGQCRVLSKMRAYHTFVAALEDSVSLAARITFETEWDNEGEGIYGGHWHFSATYIVEIIDQMLSLSEFQEAARRDQVLQKRIRAASKKLQQIRGIYVPS